MSHPQVDAPVLEAFFTKASDAALVLNRLRKILQLNPAACELTGWSERDLAQVTCRSFGCRDERGQPVCKDSCLAQQCVESGQAIGPRYLRVSRADGTGVSVEATFVPLNPQDRRSGTCLLLLKDISLLEHLDATVRRRDEEIAEKNMALRSVLEMLSTGWRAAMVQIRAGADQLAQRHSRELGDAGMVTVTHVQQGAARIETTFAQLKSRVQIALQQSHR